MTRKDAERRFDRAGEFRWMAEAEGWVLCRRKGGSAFAMRRHDWDALSRQPVAPNDRAAPRWIGWVA